MVDASNLASNDLDDRELTNTSAGILTLDQYIELFGDSDDTDLSFHGFDEDLHAMKGPEVVTPTPSEKTSARRLFKRQLSPTDESNPYKKKYLSYTKDRGNSKQYISSEQQQAGCYSRSPGDKENKLILPNDFQQRGSTLNKNQTVKNLVNKAYKIKQRKTLISPLNACPKYTSRLARPRRKQKSTYDSDFVYDPPVKKQRNKENCTEEIANLVVTEKGCDDNQDNIHASAAYKHSNENAVEQIVKVCCEESKIKKEEQEFYHKTYVKEEENEEITTSTFNDENPDIKHCSIGIPSTENVSHACDTGSVQGNVTKLAKKKKKARIKYATESDVLPGFKKKVKLKNLTLMHQQDSPYEIATLSDLPLTQIKDEPLSPSISNHVKDDESMLFDKTRCEQKNFTDIFLNYCEERENFETLSSSSTNKKDSFTDLLLQDKDGNYTSLIVDKSVGKHMVKTEDKADFGSIKNSFKDDQPHVVLTDYLSNSNMDIKHQTVTDEESNRKLSESGQCWQHLNGNQEINKSNTNNTLLNVSKCQKSENIKREKEQLDDCEKHMEKISNTYESKTFGKNIQKVPKKRGRPAKNILQSPSLSSDKIEFKLNTTQCETSSKQSLPELQTKTLTNSMQNSQQKTYVAKVPKLKKGGGNPLQLKVIKKNDKIQIVNFKNELITFCGSCSNCKRNVDCDDCKLCKNVKKRGKRLLPCWKRRCLNPIIGEVVNLLHHKTSKPEKIDIKENVLPEKVLPVNDLVKEIKEEVKRGSSLEKVEVCLISDNSIQSSAKEGEDGEIEFHVQHSQKKARKKDLNTSDIDVFTGITEISPFKTKLRSTMNELTTRIDPMDTLPRIGFGPETLAKLPWPHDTIEDAAWVSGHHFCLTTPMDLDLLNLCFLCGSAGKEKMVICNFCCEMFHPYCLDVDPIDHKNWRCDRCKRCIVCGFKGNLLMCDRCHDCYHADCLGPFYQRDTEGDEETWLCGKCVQCTKCGQRRAGKEKTSKWMFNFSMCEDCGINWKKGNYCPVCQKIFGDNDHHLKMMCCCNCERWLHMECEGISIDDYEILTDLPEIIPYICKICSGKDKSIMPWFIEVQEELNGGFLKVYYDVTSHQDMKLVKKQLGEIEAIVSSLEIFDVVFSSIQACKFSCVNDFHVFMLEAIQKLSFSIKEVIVADIPITFYPNMDRLKSYFEKALKTLFPWFSPNLDTNTESKPPGPFLLEPDTLKTKEIALHDHKYTCNKAECKQKSASSSSEDEWAFNIILRDDKPKPRKHVDIRRCIFCNQFGDGEEFNTGRLLYAGVNEWVHINCALWSAEVYEDDQGRLKHVYDALKRGNKLKCDCCDQLGATIGCCTLKCSNSYHFYCAFKSKVIFLDDKKIYCEVHASKANKNLILKTAQLSVPRRVVVDLARFKSLRRVQRGLDPKSINVYCGGFSLQSLGALSEQSDVKRALIPIGYNVTRIFWSSKRPTRRCKYTCEIQMLRDQVTEEIETEIATKEVIGETLTYCHDSNEWQNIKNRTVCTCKPETKSKTKRGMKRKIDFLLPCEKCIANQSYVYQKHFDFLAMLRKNRLVTEVDHNFFPIEAEKVEPNDVSKNENCSIEKVNSTARNYVPQIHKLTISPSAKTDFNANITDQKSSSILNSAGNEMEIEKVSILKDNETCTDGEEITVCQNSRVMTHGTSVSTVATTTTHIPVLPSVACKNAIVSNVIKSTEKLLNPGDEKIQSLEGNLLHTKYKNYISDCPGKVKMDRYNENHTTETYTNFISSPTLTVSNTNITVPSIHNTNSNSVAFSSRIGNTSVSTSTPKGSGLLMSCNAAVSVQPGVVFHTESSYTNLNLTNNVTTNNSDKSNCIFSNNEDHQSKFFDPTFQNKYIPYLALGSSGQSLQEVNNISRTNTKKHIHTDIKKMRTNLYNKLSQGYKSDGKLACNNEFVLGHTGQFTSILNSPGHIVDKANTAHIINYSVCTANASQIYNVAGVSSSTKHSCVSPLETYLVPSSNFIRNNTSNPVHKVTLSDTSPSMSFPSASNLRNSCTNNLLINDVNTSKKINSYLHKLEGHLNTNSSVGNTLQHQSNTTAQQSQGMYSISDKSCPSKKVISDVNMNEIDVTLEQKRKTMSSLLQTNNCLKIAPSLDLKRDLLFRQLKEYLTKNPSVVNFVGNVASKEKDSNVPIVNLTEPKSNRDSVCYSVYLPEHLWNDLVNAGIAKNDIQKILRENTLRNAQSFTQTPHVSSEQSKIISPTRNDVLNKQKSFNSNPPNNYIKCPDVIKKDNSLYISPVQSVDRIPSNYLATQPLHLPLSISKPQIVPKTTNLYENTTNLYENTNALVSHTFGYHTVQSNIHTSKYSYSRPLSIPSFQSPTIVTKTSTSNNSSCENTLSPNPAKIVNQNWSPASRTYMYSHSTYSTVNHCNNVSTNLYNYNYIPTNHNTSRIPACNNVLMNLHRSPCNTINTDQVDRQLCYTPVTSASSEINSMSKPKRKYKRRVKNITAEEEPRNVDISNCSISLEDRSIAVNSNLKSGPVMRKKKAKKASNIISANTEIDFCTFDANTCGDNFVDTSLPLEEVIIPEEKHRKKSNLPKKQRRNYVQSLNNLLREQELSEKKKTETELKFVVKNEDGGEYESSSLLDLWRALIGEINDKRMEINLTPFQIDLNDAYEFMGVTKEFIAYLVEQLPGGHKCRNYKFQHHLPCLREDHNDLVLNPSGFARGEIAVRNAENDMFAWLASPYRLPPKYGDECVEEEVLGGMADLPVTMKYRFLKNTSKDHVGVFRSKIQGRGLYCKKTIEGSDMIIEYSGEVIRASLTDRREEYYEKQGIGCYMFRIDEMEVVDATMKGNAARFINHSCEPNCFSKIINADGSKKIVIYALRRINVGEELTYDYKFNHEDDKLPCYCGAKKCRKYMN